MSNDASEAWTLLFRLFVSQRGRVPQVAAEFDLSPMQAHVLRLLEPDEPLPMRTLAGKLCCDASNVTGIADRLEMRGLIERRSADGDRRVRALALTPAGVALRDRALEIMNEPPASIAALSEKDQRALRDILRRAVALLRSDA